MDRDSRIASQVYTAKSDKAFADSFIRSYIPFIKKEVSAFINRVCTDSDDEYSIGLMAFYEAIRGYDADKGAFLSYAKLTVKSRLIDFARRESRHLGHISIDDDTSEDERPYAEHQEGVSRYVLRTGDGDRRPDESDLESRGRQPSVCFYQCHLRNDVLHHHDKQKPGRVGSVPE